MSKVSDLEVSTNFTEKWDAQEAGREVAKTTIEKLSYPPNFLLLFPTIHYANHGGFQEFLNGAWDVLPTGTPIIGGTVTGFMNDYGCFSRGAVALAVSYPNMDIAVGVGHNTKKNPEKAANECAQSLIKGLEKSTYPETFIFQLVSGPTIPNFPGVGSSFILKGKFKSSLAAKLIETSTKKLQRGIGREEEVLGKMSEIMKDSFIISGSSSDDMKLSNNYQFINNNVFTNSVVAIGLKIDRDIGVKYNHGFYKLSNEGLRITDSSFEGKIIKKINNNDAVKEFLKAINWAENMLDENLHRKTFFFPLGCEYSDHTLAPAAIGAILGGSFSFSFKVNSDELYVLSASGKSIIDGIESCMDEHAMVNFGISCCANLVTLGDDIYLLQEKIKKYLKNFLVVFTLGEGVYLPSEKIPKFFNETSVLLSIK